MCGAYGLDRRNEQVLISVDKLTKQNATLERELDALNSSEVCDDSFLYPATA